VVDHADITIRFYVAGKSAEICIVLQVAPRNINFRAHVRKKKMILFYLLLIIIIPDNHYNYYTNNYFLFLLIISYLFIIYHKG